MFPSEENEDPFAAAVVVAFQEMAELDVFPNQKTAESISKEVAEIAATIQLTTQHGVGSLTLRLPEELAVALARRILAKVRKEPDHEMVLDCVGEIANVVAGQAKTLLLGTPKHFTLSPPTVSTGSTAQCNSNGVPMSFASDLGSFSLYVNLPTLPQTENRPAQEKKS